MIERKPRLEGKGAIVLVQGLGALVLVMEKLRQFYSQGRALKFC